MSKQPQPPPPRAGSLNTLGAAPQPKVAKPTGGSHPIKNLKHFAHPKKG